jgi:hypothetical protein
LGADATLWLAYEFGGPDEQTCRRVLESCGAEFLDLRLANLPPAREVAEWIVTKSIRTLHVTGSRERYRPPYVLPVCFSYLIHLFSGLEHDPDPRAVTAFGLAPS